MKAENRFVPRWLPLQTLEARMVLSADLVVDAVNAPTEAELGSTVEVSWLVRNAGESATTQTGWDAGLYLSADDVLSGDDIWLGDHYAELSGTPLEPGETRASATQVTLPFDALLAAGEYRIIVDVDYGQWQPEGNEANNAAVSGSMGVSVPALPDLSVSGVSTPASGQFGQTLAISWTITNTGPGATFVSWSDGVYLSSDDVLDGSDLWVEIVEASVPTGPLGAGESVTIQATVRLPVDGAPAPGSYRLIVAADGYGQQAETDEENNTQASDVIEIAAAAPADLVVQDVVTVTTGEFGDVVTLTWTVRNNGEGAATWYGDEVYLSADAILDGSDILLTSLDGMGWSGMPLEPGQSVQMSATVRLDGGAGLASTPGTYRLLVQTDAWASVAESNEENNTGVSAEIEIGTPTPADLVVESGAAPATGELGQVIEVTWVVKNQGVGSASTWGWTDGVFLSLDGTLGGDDVQVGWADPAWLNALNLAAGASLAGVAQVWLPQDGSLQPGTYQVIIAADINGQVFDADPTNNTLVIATIEITGEVLGTPEFNPEPELSGGWGFPSFGSATGGGPLRSSTADGLGQIAANTAANTASASEPALVGVGSLGDLGGLSAASDLGTGLYVFTDRIGAPQGAKGLAKINLRVASESSAAVVRSSYVQ